MFEKGQWIFYSGGPASVWQNWRPRIRFFLNEGIKMKDFCEAPDEFDDLSSPIGSG